MLYYNIAHYFTLIFTCKTGKEDDICPIDEVRASYAAVEKIYEMAGAPDACRLVETPNGHYWRADLVWSAVREEAKKLGWFN